MWIIDVGDDDNDYDDDGCLCVRSLAVFVYK